MPFLRPIAIGAAACVAAVLFVYLVFKLAFVFALLIGIAIGGALVIFLIARSRGESPVAVAKEVVAEAPRPRDSEPSYVYERMLGTNQSLRVLEGVSIPVVEAAEGIIDVLRDLVIRLNQDFPGDSMTFETCRIGTYHLPRLLEPYMKVPAGNRHEAEADVLKALAALRQEVDSIDDLLRAQNVDAARTRATGVEMRFASVASPN